MVYYIYSMIFSIVHVVFPILYQAKLCPNIHKWMVFLLTTSQPSHLETNQQQDVIPHGLLHLLYDCQHSACGIPHLSHCQLCIKSNFFTGGGYSF